MEISPENSPTPKGRKIVDYGVQRKINDTVVNHVVAVVPKANEAGKWAGNEVLTTPAPVPKPKTSLDKDRVFSFSFRRCKSACSFRRK